MFRYDFFFSSVLPKKYITFVAIVEKITMKIIDVWTNALPHCEET